MFVANYVPHPQGLGGLNAGELSMVAAQPGLFRPYLDNHGRRCALMYTGRMITDNKSGKEIREQKAYTLDALARRNIYSPVGNASLMPIRSWIQLDDMIDVVRRERLSAWDDLAASSRVDGFDAMSKLTYEYQTMSDAGEAVKDMDLTSPGRADQPLMDIKSIPLAMTHSDFYFSQRQIGAWGGRLDTTMGEMATRRVLEMVEDTTIGTVTGMTYGSRSTGPDAIVGTSTEYGYTNFPYRVTKTDLTVPLGTNPEAVMQDVIEMRETMYTNKYYGPFVLYHSTSYDQWFDNDYFRTGGTSATTTLRARLQAIAGITAIRRLDRLTTGYQLILVQMESRVAQAIVGMEPRVFRWPGRGGVIEYLMVAACLVPLLRAPYSQVAGILHGTTS